MRYRSLIWHLFPSYLLITLLAMLAVTGYATRTLRVLFLEETERDLEARARLLEYEVSELLLANQNDALNPLVKRLGEQSTTRISIILPDGTVIADSDELPVAMDNHAQRPEVEEVLQGAVGSSSRYSRTLQENMMYVAVPLVVQGELLAVIRAATPTDSVDKTLAVIYRQIAIAWLVITVLASWFSWWNARRISRPLQEIRRRANKIAEGDLTGRLPEDGPEELRTLASTMNRMAEQLDDRIKTILRQRREQKAVFKSISDGVLAIDADGLLLQLNNAAADMFGVRRKQVRGKSIHDVIRHEDLREFVKRALTTQENVEREIVLHGKTDRFLQAHGRPLRDDEGKSLGAVVVLNDVTKLLRLEQSRRDFVANVSHELRTPITSVKGFVETLLEGAMENEEDAKHFLGIIQRQANRLEAIVEDLLSLARIERESENDDIELYDASIKPALEGALLSVTQKAAERSINLVLDCDADIRSRINPPLLEQAVLNLVDNAVKYSDDGAEVYVKARLNSNKVYVDVKDNGAGIEKEHLPRLFERFYRVDKSRSRREGGTGLGLAIVKHIALAHGGNVAVESEPKKGSCFIISLPYRPL